ncbi:MAG: Nramp family divalent metal transporter [Bacteroidota bacterium]|jgi:NRAMP (natural resistance-associated macrophage protein)-like metal ion transporter|nr:Nramp family divalent metal transporter [Ignavibacteria bacterium]MCU7500646.1 Nramp family divalent metal transporter [Ignavibacteria bacterium]MCU7512779.1 Nramp family divalent metal transporter [Ignavibacteria bacterium]MCU7520339.1 Nramp family divalent metal transporter [Ignavibacteria bacterium]MCU7523942.1 Nramp family divalent metal transporter [Ignavibacteria bacterium]
MKDVIESRKYDAPTPANETESGFRKIFKKLGPGLITGASDDDPSGIATYSQIGAHFGFSMLWTILLSYPLMGAIQEISARIGRVTGRGIAGNIRKYYSRWLAFLIVGLMVTANIINIGADIAAMGSSLKLLIGGPALLYSAVFSLISIYLQIFIPYSKYVRYLKWLTMSLFAYIITVMIVKVPWGTTIFNTFIPNFSLNPVYLTSLIAVLGTTISPYLFFWQASQEVEEIKTKDEDEALKKAPEQAQGQIKRIKIDTYIGMAFSNLVSYFIILASAVTLHLKHVTEINTAADAAAALKPLAGEFSFLLFSAGIIGTGLLAIPVLAGSAAYAVGEAFRWKIGLEQKPRRARNFYSVLALSIILGLAIDFTPINPIKALFWAAVINGITAGPVMIMLMLMSANKKVMGDFTISRGLKVMGWLSTLVMILASVGLFLT